MFLMNKKHRPGTCPSIFGLYASFAVTLATDDTTAFSFGKAFVASGIAFPVTISEMPPLYVKNEWCFFNSNLILLSTHIVFHFVAKLESYTAKIQVGPEANKLPLHILLRIKLGCVLNANQSELGSQ